MPYYTRELMWRTRSELGVWLNFDLLSEALLDHWVRMGCLRVQRKDPHDVFFDPRYLVIDERGLRAELAKMRLLDLAGMDGVR
jgi:hypothetical protein